jgi:hypothetical protein
VALGMWAKAVGVAVVVAPVALTMSETVSAAPSASSDAVGQVSCSFSSGVVKLNPQRSPSGGPQVIKATLTATTGSANPCSGSVTVDGKPVTIVAAHLHLREVLVDFLDGDPDYPLVVGPVYNGAIQWRTSPKSKIATTTFSYTGGSWAPPTATVPPSGGRLVSVAGSFGGSGAAIDIGLDAPGLFPPKVPPKHTTIAIAAGTTSTCAPFGC